MLRQIGVFLLCLFGGVGTWWFLDWLEARVIKRDLDDWLKAQKEAQAKHKETMEDVDAHRLDEDFHGATWTDVKVK